MSSKIVSTNDRRIDTIARLVYVPVPPEIFKETKERIQMEMAILKAHSESPSTVNCVVADEILQKPKTPQNENMNKGAENEQKINRC